MRCQLRYLHSPDVPQLESYQPADASTFSILIQAMIGPLEGEGEESFSFVLCTPGSLAKELSTDGYRWGHSLLIVPRYEFHSLLSAVQRVCHRVEEPTWQDIANALSYYFTWEFADYRTGLPPVGEVE